MKEPAPLEFETVADYCKAYIDWKFEQFMSQPVYSSGLCFTREAMERLAILDSIVTGGKQP